MSVHNLDITKEIYDIYDNSLQLFINEINKIYNLNLKFKKTPKFNSLLCFGKTTKQSKKKINIIDKIKNNTKTLIVKPYKNNFIFQNYVLDKNCTVLCKIINNVEHNLNREDIDYLKDMNLYNFKVII